MYTWKPPAKKKEINQNSSMSPQCFSRWGQKLDQFFDAAMIREISSNTKGNLKANAEFFHIHRKHGKNSCKSDTCCADPEKLERRDIIESYSFFFLL